MRVAMGAERSHHRFLWREEITWQRVDVIIVEGHSFLIEEWVIVRGVVQWPVRSRESRRTMCSFSTERKIEAIGRTIIRTM